MRTLITIFILIYTIPLYAQQISIDRGVRVNGIWCFPIATNELQYRYLPNKVELTKGTDGLPLFSLLRYVDPLKKTGQKLNTLEVVEGGGILNFTIEYSTDERALKTAENRLKEHLQDDNIKLLGPVIFSDGQFQMVSSIVSQDVNSEEEKVLIGTGAAPVLEGSRIPFSFSLTPQQSKLLLESFKMPTPDIAVNIELQFSGLTDSYNAEMKVNWDQVGKYRKINAGAKVYFVNAEVEHEVRELFTNNSIELTTMGSDEKSEKLLNQAYQKITELLYEENSKSEMKDEKNPLDMAKLVSQSSFNFLSINAGYKQRNINRSGTSTLKFNSRNTVSRNHYIVFNIGNLFKKYGENNDMFKTVSLEDPAFLTRTVQLGIDGELYPEFDKLINNVTVQIRKMHKNGEITLREARIIGTTFQDDKLPILDYPWRQDTNKIEWLGYDYKTMYQFTGGKNYETEWRHQNASMINLFVPYTRRNIMLIGDTEVLKEKGVRAIQVAISYPFFGEDKKIQKTIRLSDLDNDTSCEITLPKGVTYYDYELTWYMQDGAMIDKSGEWKSDILFIDELN